RADDLVKEFSGGMKRRLAIGRALLHEPSILILDEPTLGVDVQGSHKIWNYIKDLSQLGKTIVVTTNVMAEAEFLCTNTLIIDNGREIVVGSPKDLVNSLGKQEIRIEFEDSLTDEQAKRYLSDYRVINNKLIVKTDNGLKDLLLLSKGLPESIKIKTVELKKPNLDDVFLHYTGKSLRD
ncbi:MAG TPA: ABC transporter ATP-binding protein, partial [Trueperaceae bacterium]|nr:ABC transporter ATP-binding protein [Trueperaceae bacterium]